MICFKVDGPSNPNGESSQHLEYRNHPSEFHVQSQNEESNSRRKSSNPRKIKRENSSEYDQSHNLVEEDSEMMGEQTSISCLLCNKLFENRNDLRKHILVGHGIDPAEVGYPDTAMDELSIQRTKHMDESEMAESMLESETVFCCEVCIREFNDRASLWLHMLYSHREEASTACGICLKVCSDNVSLLEHVDSCHPRDTMSNEKRRYSCQICARQHDSRKKLLVHVKIHNLRDADGRALDPESMVVLNSDMYNQDVPPSNEVGMDDEFSFSCEICFRSFPSEVKLVKHKRNAHKDSELMHSFNSSATYKLYFTCEVCGLAHSTRTERWKHVFTNHANEPTLVCDKEKCAKVFPTKALRTEHVTNHHDLQGDLPNTCEICGKLWATKLNYWKHMMGVHADSLPFICGVCLKITCSVADLQAHVKDKHYPLDNSVEFCCDICGRPYSKKSKMTRHRRIHNLPSAEGGLEEGLFELQEAAAAKEEALRCDECPTEQFLDLEELSEHRRSAHDLAPCDLCPKFYGRTSHLWKHVYKIHKTHPDVTCNICLKTSASRVHLAKHYAKHHKDHPSVADTSYVTLQDVVNNPGEAHNCTKCNKVFRKDHLMRQHLKHCTGPREPDDVKTFTPASVNGSFPCEKCSRVFDTPGVLRKHVRTSHITYSCELCEVSKDTKTELFDHVSSDHTNHPDLTCDAPDCNKMFRSSKDCTKHKKDHKYSGNIPPSCAFCGELITNRIKLRKHLRSNHAEKSKYMCSLCAISHLSFNDLQDHIRQNHPSCIGKMYTCQICARKCPTKYKLDTHLKVHGSEFFNCLTCYKVFTDENEFKKHDKVHPQKKLNTPKLEDKIKDSDDESETEEGSKRKRSPESHGEEKLMKLSHNCVCCKLTFGTKSELSRHQIDEHIDLKCENCNTFSENDEALSAHKNICRPREARKKRKTGSLSTSLFEKCLERAMRYDSEEDVSATNQSSTNSIDENSSSSKEMWGVTRRSVTSTRKVYENDNSLSACEHCDKVWPAKRVLWQHMIRTHKTEAATTCGVCLKFCSSYRKLDLHLAEEHPHNFEDDDSIATCRVCGRYHNARSKLQLHAAIHAGDENRSWNFEYKCPDCSKTFTARGFLTKHMTEDHNMKCEDDDDEDDYIPPEPSYPVDNPFKPGFSSDDDTQFEGFPVDESDDEEVHSSKKVALESFSKESAARAKDPLVSPKLEQEDPDASCDVASLVQEGLDESCDEGDEVSIVQEDPDESEADEASMIQEELSEADEESMVQEELSEADEESMVQEDLDESGDDEVSVMQDDLEKSSVCEDEIEDSVRSEEDEEVGESVKSENEEIEEDDDFEPDGEDVEMEHSILSESNDIESNALTDNSTEVSKCSENYEGDGELLNQNNEICDSVHKDEELVSESTVNDNVPSCNIGNISSNSLLNTFQPASELNPCANKSIALGDEGIRQLSSFPVENQTTNDTDVNSFIT